MYFSKRNPNCSTGRWYSFIHERQRPNWTNYTIDELIFKSTTSSGLHLDIGKFEILSLFDTDDEYICNIPLKKSVKYLGIDVTKEMLARQQLYFLPRLKTKTTMNMWLQRDLSIFGRILLTKAEGISRLVYPALSLYVQDSTFKEINNILSNFAWKNRHHYLIKYILCGPRNFYFKHIQDQMDQRMYQSIRLYLVLYSKQYV